MEFGNLSPAYILNRINEAQKKNKKIKFKGIGIESTLYYNKYMLKDDNKRGKTALPEKCLKVFHKSSLPSEHVKSVNRINKHFKKVAIKRGYNFPEVLESGLDNAFKMMARNSNKMASCIKYQVDNL